MTPNIKSLTGFIALMALLVTTSANADNSQQAIKDIRARYQIINSDIQACLEVNLKELEPIYGDEPADINCPYYLAIFKQNVRNKPVAAVGKRIVTTQFWFDSSPEYDGAKLYKVNQINDIAMGKNISSEFLFDDNNQLIFYYHHDPIYTNSDTRLYFSQGKLIKAIPKKSANNESVDEILKKAKTFVLMADF